MPGSTVLCILSDRACGTLAFGARSNDVDCVVRYQPARGPHGTGGNDNDGEHDYDGDDEHAGGGSDGVEGRHPMTPNYASTQCLDDAHGILGLAPRADDGFVHALNDRGVVGSTCVVTTRCNDQFYGAAMADPCKTADTAFQDDKSPAYAPKLLRLSLERASTARDAVSVITDLLQGSPQEVHAYGNKFVLADRGEAWVVDTVGRFWAARRVRSGGLSTTNALCVGENHDRIAPGTEAFARARGWWPRSSHISGVRSTDVRELDPVTEANVPFSFAGAFGAGNTRVHHLHSCAWQRHMCVDARGQASISGIKQFLCECDISSASTPAVLIVRLPAPIMNSSVASRMHEPPDVLVGTSSSDASRPSALHYARIPFGVCYPLSPRNVAANCREMNRVLEGVFGTLALTRVGSMADRTAGTGTQFYIQGHQTLEIEHVIKSLQAQQTGTALPILDSARSPSSVGLSMNSTHDTTSIDAVAAGDHRRKQRRIFSLLTRALKRAVGGGVSGATAMIVQVLTLMWLRTAINVQYVTGLPIRDVMSMLWYDGGVSRFYRGLPLALVLGPLARFGDTAAAAGVPALIGEMGGYGRLASGLCVSMAATAWRVIIMPVDNIKLAMQVSGGAGMHQLRQKVRRNGFGALFEGAAAGSLAAFVGHYPWYVVHDMLEARLPQPCSTSHAMVKHIRAAIMGFCASVASDCCSNGVRVIKSVKQTSPKAITYRQAASQVLREDGVLGLLTRGLGLKLAANAVSAMLFTVVWQALSERLAV